MSERVAGSSHQQLHHFIADSEWSAEAVMREVAQKTAVSFESLAGSTGLIAERLQREAVRLPVLIWTGEAAEVEAVWLLISRALDGQEIRYSVCDKQSGELTLQEIVFRKMQRYWVEREFRKVKEQLGMAQYQVRSWRARHHHIALTMMAPHFILFRNAKPCRCFRRGREIDVGANSEKQTGRT